MNIVLFTQEDPFYVKIFFETFLKEYKQLDEIRAIVVSNAMGKKSKLKLAKKMLSFYGPALFMKMGARYAGIKAIDKLSRCGNWMNTNLIRSSFTIQQIARRLNLNVIERSDLNSDDFLHLITKFDPDLFISIASPVIFKEKLINLPKIDCINIHNAPLPKYRGMLPNFWQLFHGEQKAGITVHRIEKGIDTGAIILQRFIEIDENETLDSLIKKTKRLDAQMIAEVIEMYRQGKVNPKKMEGDGSYFSFPTRQEVKQFLSRGKKLF